MAGRRQRKVDHISPLPDAVIHHIFSFLPFKDVIKTSVLSKQWRFAWTFTPYIDASLSSKGVVPSISRALSLRTATEIEKFHLDASSMPDSYISWELNRCFGFAVARKVKDASLVFGRSTEHIPRILCDCASLVSFRVSGCYLPKDTTINWPSLKKLCIHDAWLNDDQIMKILNGCPVLESLKLRPLRMLSNLQIDSRSLRELVIESDGLSTIDISAPDLFSLRFSGGFFKNKDFPELYDFDEKQFWPSQKEFHCVANHLKSVEIIGLEFNCENSKILLALAKFLLKEAVGLEKITIDAELRMSRQGVTIDPRDLRDFHDVIQLQKGSRRASRKAEVIVKYRFNGPRYELRKHKQNTGTQSIPRFA
ncbi:hypothetical protein BT93_F1500 [Corymbia citriodora subsp. variegata]|nr:hypothetical protein BT93_F1500 [Corymbia citriodora subsp. variegata]